MGAENREDEMDVGPGPPAAFVGVGVGVGVGPDPSLFVVDEAGLCAPFSALSP